MSQRCNLVSNLCVFHSLWTRTCSENCHKKPRNSLNQDLSFLGIRFVLGSYSKLLKTENMDPQRCGMFCCFQCIPILFCFEKIYQEGLSLAFLWWTAGHNSPCVNSFDPPFMVPGLVYCTDVRISQIKKKKLRAKIRYFFNGIVAVLVRPLICRLHVLENDNYFLINFGCI